jgi:hypothetical protein
MAGASAFGAQPVMPPALTQPRLLPRQPQRRQLFDQRPSLRRPIPVQIRCDKAARAHPDDTSRSFRAAAYVPRTDTPRSPATPRISYRAPSRKHGLYQPRVTALPGGRGRLRPPAAGCGRRGRSGRSRPPPSTRRVEGSVSRPARSRVMRNPLGWAAGRRGSQSPQSPFARPVASMSDAPTVRALATTTESRAMSLQGSRRAGIEPAVAAPGP